MSLSTAQKQATRREFAENLARLSLTPQDIATALDTTPQRIEDIIALRNIRRLEDAWVVRRYLLEYATQTGIGLKPFTALRGNPEDYWFLDASRIDRMKLD